MIFPDHKLRLATPTPGELDLFDQSVGLGATVLAKAWSYISAKALTPACRVQLVSGEHAGLIGTLVTVTDDICALLPDHGLDTVIDVHFSDLRIHFCVGDYVRVKAGRLEGSVGWVSQVERNAELDLVTFVDDRSTTNRRATEVSIFLVLCETTFNTSADYNVLFRPRNLRSAFEIHLHSSECRWSRHLAFNCDTSL